VDVLHISGGLFERSAASAQRVPPEASQTRFFGDFLVANKKVTRPPGRNPASAKNHPAKAQNKQKNSYYPR
jgi:hypothetical protein